MGFLFRRHVKSPLVAEMFNIVGFHIPQVRTTTSTFFSLGEGVGGLPKIYHYLTSHVSSV